MLHQLPIRVYYADTDAGGVLHHSAHIRFLERGRTEHLRQAGFELSTLVEKYSILFAVKNINITYLKPILLDSLIVINTWIQVIKKASIIYRQTIYLNGENDSMLGDATVELVCVDQAFKPCALPEVLKNLQLAENI